MKKILLLILAIGFACVAVAQQQSREASRYEIDAKRIGLNPTDKEALFRSREFIRLDPTYYVGYFYEAIFKYDRASDYLGFRNVIPSLKKSISLLEKDFSAQLSKQYTSRADYASLAVVREDYVLLTHALVDCYSNLEQPDSVVLLLNHYKKWKFQRDQLDANTTLAWTMHRNRFYTTDKYSFLGKSIEENEKTALSYLYKAKGEIEKNRALNEQVFSAMAVLGDELGVCHYMALVHSYLRNTDSAYYYFQQMEGYNVFPYNNFAIFCFVDGDFYRAQSYFGYAQMYDYGDKRIRESDIYLGIISVFQAQPEQAITTLKNQIQQMGVVPGWGWTNIALARSYLYNGQLDKSAEHLAKANGFKEVHIGTTWGQSHYDISIAVLDLMIKERRQAAVKFENKGYWYSPRSLAKLAQYSVEKDAMQLLLLNRLASNPERKEVFYSIFASENTVTFDEIWYMLKDYGQKFFLNLFQEQAKSDSRMRIQKYFKLFAAKLVLEQGDKEEAAKQLRKIEKSEPIDPEFEQLFAARIREAQAMCSGNQADAYRLYKLYPQLVPFSGLTLRMRLSVYDDGRNITKDKVLNTLKGYNVDWVSESESGVPRAIVRFSNDGKNDIISYHVEVKDDDSFVAEHKIVCNTSVEDAAKQLVYGLFKIADPEDVTEDEGYTY